jgi:hypothetical protein
MHTQTHFELSGAHTATPCIRCHTPAADGWTSFHFVSFNCESCHKDIHAGQFSGRMVEKSCATCHTTDTWKPQLFDHATARFPLTGRHVNVQCERCHQSTSVSGKLVVQYRGVSMSCQSCHPDVHANQFAKENVTDCSRCHTAVLWRSLAFDHNTQSTFSLTGAHQKVECQLCHREERVGEKIVIRYKPVPSQCESCHTNRRERNG